MRHLFQDMDRLTDALNSLRARVEKVVRYPARRSRSTGAVGCIARS
jgi:hypothetical protein